MVSVENRTNLSQYSELDVVSMLDLTSAESARLLTETKRAFEISANLFPAWEEENAMQNFKNLSSILLHLVQMTNRCSRKTRFQDRYSLLAEVTTSSLSPFDKFKYDSIVEYIIKRLQYVAPSPLTAPTNRQIPLSFIRNAQSHLARNAAFATFMPGVESPFSVLTDYYHFGGGPLILYDDKGSNYLSGHIVINAENSELLACFNVDDQSLVMQKSHSWSEHLSQAAS